MADTRLAVGIAEIAGCCVALSMLVAWWPRKPAKRGEWQPVEYEWECTETLPSGYKRWELMERQRNVLAENEFRCVRVGWGDTDYPILSHCSPSEPAQVHRAYRLRTARG